MRLDTCWIGVEAFSADILSNVRRHSEALVAVRDRCRPSEAYINRTSRETRYFLQ